MRHEVKYKISTLDSLSICAKLKHLLPLDDHCNQSGKYHVRSLYFDDPAQTCLQEKLDGVMFRKKYRLRYYNQDSSLIKLECKKKFNQISQKLHCSLSKQECQWILEKKFKAFSKNIHPLLSEFLCEVKQRALKPVVIIDFTREAYHADYQDIRITFDRQLRTQLNFLHFFDTKKMGLLLLPDSETILEVKYAHFLPSYIKAILETNSPQCQAISKYALSRLTY